jgi:EmrB/QacA subfamily drug resistance transporter
MSSANTHKISHIQFSVGNLSRPKPRQAYTEKVNKQQKLVLYVSILASLVAFLDGSVVNVALPAIVKELGGGLVTQQWVIDAYMITLGSLMLLAGSLSDLIGRKKILAVGLVLFGVTSLLCAVAPNAPFLIAARALQGVAGALLVPSSLALIISSFSGAEKGKAIGTWTAWTGIAFVIGPLLGGLLVDVWSWRLIFIINVIPIGITLWLMSRLTVAEDIIERTRIDIFGALLGVAALGGPVYALIEQAHYGWRSPLIYGPLAAGLLAGWLFIRHERRSKAPMMPLGLFKVRNFSVGNIATLCIYAGLAVSSFLIAVFVQQVGGYSATNAGLALLPVTIVMFFLSSKFGALAGEYGPRLFMGLGPIIAGLGFLTMLRVDQDVAYWTQLFPGVVIFALGLSVTVAPLTAAVLGSISSKQAGIGSAINNAISRIAGLVGVAGIGLVTGPALTVVSFRRGVVVMALLLIAGGVVSAIGIQNQPKA